MSLQTPCTSSIPSTSSPSSAWLSNRVRLPSQFRHDDLFTDVELRVSGCSFRAHRLVLSAHSEFFLSLFTSGMRETKEGVVELREVDPDVFGKVLEYVYDGVISGSYTFEVLRSIFLTANMWLITDLEEAVLQRMFEVCTGQKCLKMLLSIRGLESLLWDCRGKQKLENFLAETVGDSWHLMMEPSNNLGSVPLVDLDLESLKSVLSIKSDREVIADFSFSFNQNELCLAVVAWVKSNLEQRWNNLDELSVYFCLQQINPKTRTLLENLISDIEGICGTLLDLNHDSCRGIWCPKRQISGLIVATCSPSVNNNQEVASGPILHYYFTCPTVMASSAGSTSSTSPLSPDCLYAFTSNNCLPPSVTNFDDDDKSTGKVVDSIATGLCRDRHSAIYNFCPSSISECRCDLGQVSAYGGGSYVKTCHACRMSDSSCDPCCLTIDPHPEQVKNSATRNSIFTVSNGTLYSLGGYRVKPGNALGYVHCTYEPRIDDPRLARIKTGHGSVLEMPQPNLSCSQYRLRDKGPWTEAMMDLPSAIGDAASVTVAGDLLVIGGFEVVCDDQKQLYQRPLCSVWIFTGQSWRRGPDLPCGVTRGAASSQGGRIYLSGGATLKISGVEPDKKYEYVVNASVFCLDVGWAEWKLALDLERYSAMKEEISSVLSVFPAGITLTMLKVKKKKIGAKYFGMFEVVVPDNDKGGHDDRFL